MSVTNYDKNREAADSVYFRNRFSVALAAAASNILTEDPSWLSPPTGFFSEYSTAWRQNRLYQFRAALCNKVAANPSGYATQFAISCAVSMNVYLDTDVIKKIVGDAEAVDADYLNACGGLWTLWATEEVG